MSAQPAAASAAVSNRTPLYMMMFPVIAVPVLVIVWVAVHGSQQEQFYDRGLDAMTQKDFRLAAANFARAADHGHIEARYQLSVLHRNGWGVKNDPRTAVQYLTEAALAGSVAAEYELGSAAENADRPDYPAAAEHYRRAAAKGHVGALTALGRLCESGRGVSRNYRLAEEFYRQAALVEDREAQCSLGELYAGTQLGKADFVRAAEMLTRAAQAGHPRAQGNLGFLYEKGRISGTPDFARAVVWYEKAIAGDDPAAMVNYGDLLEKGDVVPGDLERATRLYRAAADREHPAAWCKIGMLYYTGRTEERRVDYAAAQRCFRRAADLGDFDALMNIGVMYERGQGVVANSAMARKCYVKAQKAGHPEAALRLAELEKRKP